MTDTDQTTPQPGDFTGEWDPTLLRLMVTVGRPICKFWFRSEVGGLDRFPAAGGALIVSNHSGGALAMDVPILWVDFFKKFGYDRPLYTLAHDLVFRGPATGILSRLGMIRATRENAARALRSGAVVIVFPGGDNDAMRPTRQQNAIDFGGRMGYVTTAIEAGVPIVPAVSIGGQETQFFLPALIPPERLGLKRVLRIDRVPISMGIPFVVSPGAYNFPLPAKIVTEVLEPVDVVARFGEHPDVVEVDAHVRKVMQSALDELAAQRRFPILG